MLRLAVFTCLFTCSITLAADISGGDLIIPNVGLDALQEFNPLTNTVVQTLSLPSGYTYAGAAMLETALVRSADNGILTNARDSSGRPVALALSNTGSFTAVQIIAGASYLQQLAFDPLDSTQHTVLGGAPFLPEVVGIDPYSHAATARITEAGANYIGLTTDSAGHIFAGNFSSGTVTEYQMDGTGGSLYANICTSGSCEINGLALNGNTLYVAQNSSNRLAVFTGGLFTGVITSGAFDHPSTVFYNPVNGYLYVGDQNDDVLNVLSASGTLVDSIRMGGSDIGTAAIVPVSSDAPEPVSVALLGVGLLGVAYLPGNNCRSGKNGY